MRSTITIPGTIAQVRPRDLAYGFLVTIGDGTTVLPSQLVLVTASPLAVVFEDIVPGATYSGTYQAVDNMGEPLDSVPPVSFSFDAVLQTVPGIVATGQPTVTIES